MDVAITILLAIFTVAAVAVALLLYLALRAPSITSEDDLGDHHHTVPAHQPGHVIDQFGSEKGITR